MARENKEREEESCENEDEEDGAQKTRRHVPAHNDDIAALNSVLRNG